MIYGIELYAVILYSLFTYTYNYISLYHTLTRKADKFAGLFVLLMHTPSAISKLATYLILFYPPSV